MQRSPSLAQHWRGSRNLLPALIFLGLFFFAPLIGLLLRGVLEPVPGLGNYEQLFANSAYSRVLLNTFSVAGLVTLFSLLLGFPLAWVITLVPRGWGRWILNIVLLSMWTSLLARTYSWLVLLQASGVVNKALMAMGIIDQPLEMVHNLTGVVIGMSYIMIPFIVLPLQATMQAIDPMVLQAGSICGASPWTNFFRVFLPLCRPGLFSGGADGVCHVARLLRYPGAAGWRAEHDAARIHRPAGAVVPQLGAGQCRRCVAGADYAGAVLLLPEAPAGIAGRCQ